MSTPLDAETLIELTAAALYAAASLDHAKRDEAPWPPYENVADQSKSPYRKQAERLFELHLVILPVGRLKALETALLHLDQEVRRLQAAARKHAKPKAEPKTVDAHA